ncbi:MAG: hypothetical protein HZC01_04930 [Candidatus Kerfeldbacteria bacterium]|nr:hypothetical protein [Candidatus Kerfeldbacteria bacterium]
MTSRIYLIKNLLINNSALPTKVGENLIVNPTKEEYWRKMINANYIDTNYINIAIHRKYVNHDPNDFISELKDVGRVIAILRIIHPNTAKISGLYIYEKNTNTFLSFPIAKGINPYIHEKVAEPKPIINHRDLDLLSKTWKKVSQLYSGKEYSRLRNTIDFVEHSRWTTSITDSIINLVTALESLYTSDNIEVSNKIATRVAWFLHPLIKDANKRIELVKEVKKLYTFRSFLLHGNDVSKYLEKTDEYIKTATYILRASILKILRDERNENLFTIFTSKENSVIEEYFLELCMGEKSINQYKKFN